MRELRTCGLQPLKTFPLRRLSGWKKAHALSLFFLATAIALPAQTFTNLVSFDLSNGAALSVFLV